jgi:hypothetical protein
MRRGIRAALAAAVVALAGCSDSSGPKIGPPARLDITATPVASAMVGSSAGILAVVVKDQSGSPVPDAAVSFTVAGSATIAPNQMKTGADGVAQTVVSLGTISGPVSITASVTGSTAVATVAVVATPGPVARITASPKSRRLYGPGDTVRVTATASDQYGNPEPATAVAYSVTNPTLLGVDATGLVRVLQQGAGGTASVVASSGGKSDSATITVLPQGTTVCAGIAGPTALAVGAVATFSGVAHGCLTGGASGAEFTLLAYNASTNGSASIGSTVMGEGLTTAPSTARLAPVPALAARVPTVRGTAATALVADVSFHLQLQARARDALRGRSVAARAWLAASRARRAVAPTQLGSFSVGPAFSSIPASPTVGGTVRVNVNANQACASPIYHGARIAAVGARSIVLADTLNPVGGFTDADYQRFAARFDTLVYPLDVDNFGAPSDVDGNGRVAILFTRAVNELTLAGSSSFVGGFFYARDLYPAAPATGPTCPGSNEAEMFYMLVPDPKGTVNGNVRRTGFVDSLTTGVLAHEFQHLINSGRRLYVNNAPEAGQDEVVWLNEGLSHVAEELLYYRESGMTPRHDLGDADVRVSSMATYPYFKSDAAQNFSRFISYLEAPESNSPVADDDELATRGATWSFLRYAVDQLGTSDAAVWARFDNSTTTGLATLQLALGRDPAPLFRSWAIAHYLDDTGISTDPAFQHRSWNYRSLYGTTFGSRDASGNFTPLGFPLRITGLSDATATSSQVRGTSAAYYRLAVSAGREALLTFGTGTSAPDAALQFIVVRTK